VIFIGKEIIELEEPYANYFKILRNASEFVIDLGQPYPENDQAELSTRIITNPTYAKVFLNTIQETIKKY